MIYRSIVLGVGIAVIACVAGGRMSAADTIQVTKQTLDHVELKLDRISKTEPFHVQLFDVADADLGKPKHRDTAEMLARSAPHLLAVDIVEALREAGFGAGESKVCVIGRIDDEAGKMVGEFSHCQKGLGWGKSDNQMESSAARVGDSIAMFLTQWADGEFAQ
jgi:hypothetical protein